MTDFNTGLERRPVNFAALTPLDFLARSAEVYGSRPAIVYGSVRRSWRETDRRARQLASGPQLRGIGRGDTVAVLLPNIPEMVEVHFGVPMGGTLLNTSPASILMVVWTLIFPTDASRSRGMCKSSKKWFKVSSGRTCKVILMFVPQIGNEIL